MINLFRPAYDFHEKNAVAEVLESRWSGFGPKMEEFESEFAKYLGVKYCVLTNSCTAALHLALKLKGIGPGHKVAVPTMTFASTAHVVKQVGAEPVLCDINPDNLLMRMWTVPPVDAFLPVLYAGQPYTCGGSEGPTIYDCAHAVGSTFDARDKLCCWSFHAVKNLAMGEGGCLTTDDEELAIRARKLRWMGINKDTYARSRGSYGWEYDIEELGYKSHGNSLVAAIGIEQLKKLSWMQPRRQVLWNRYRQELGIVDWLPGHSSLLAVLKHKNRNSLIEHLREKGIASGVHYKPLNLMSCYKNQIDNCPVASKVWTELITLPLFPEMTDDEQTQVIEAVRSFG